MAALDHRDLALDHRGEVRRPVAERRQAGARRQADADRADPAQGAPLHDGVDEMRRADHDGIDGLVADGAGCREAGERVEDPAGHVWRRRRLDGGAHPPLLDQHRIRVGAADVDADASHPNTGR